MAQSSKSALKLTIEEEMFARLDALVPKVASSAAAREFGITVDRHLVARMALLRGLKVMESGEQTGRVAPPPPLASRESKPSPPPPKPAEPVDRDEGGHILPPDGWERWSDSEAISPTHSEVHGYYTANGWVRFWGKAGDEVIAFYWSGDPELQDLPMFKHPDRNGLEVKLQETPYGPGHIIPHGWAGAVEAV